MTEPDDLELVRQIRAQVRAAEDFAEDDAPLPVTPGQQQRRNNAQRWLYAAERATERKRKPRKPKKKQDGPVIRQLKKQIRHTGKRGRYSATCGCVDCNPNAAFQLSLRAAGVPDEVIERMLRE